MHIILEADKFTEEGEASENGRPDTSSSWEFGDIRIAERATYRDDHEDLSLMINGDFDLSGMIYAVVVVWSDGDSFGWDQNARAEIISAHSDQKSADVASAMIEENKSSEEPLLLPDGYELRYIPWAGSMSDFSYVEVISHDLSLDDRPSP